MKRIYTTVLFVMGALVVMAQCPTAFTVTGGGVCAGATVTLSSSEPGVNYQLKSGTINVGSVVAGTGNALTWSSFISPSSPTFTVVGTNTSSGCSQTMSGSATFTFPNITISNTSGGTNLTCFITPLLFTGTSITTGASFSWTGPGGFTSTQAQMVVTVPGTYTFAVTGLGGCVSTRTRTITQTLVSPKATAAVSGTILCANRPVTLQGSSTGTPVTYSWTGSGNFTSTQQNPLVSVPGDYAVTITSPGNCQNTANVTVTAAANISLPDLFTLNGGGTICPDAASTLNLSGSQAEINYQLELNGAAYGSAITGTGSTLNWSNLTVPGTYTVTGTNAATTCAQPMQGGGTVVVSKPSVFNLGGGGTICPSSSTQLTLSSSEVGITYQLKSGSLNVGSVVAGTGNPLNWPVTSQGVYAVTATNTLGCSLPMNNSAAISINPFPETSITGATQVGNTPITLSAVTGSGYTYQWRRDEDNLQNQTGATLQVAATGNYEVEITSNGCSKRSPAHYVSAPVKPNFNGMIASTRWRTTKAFGVNDADLQGLYTYTYDDKYQFKEAQWADPGNSFSFSNAYRATNMSYDPNGNINTLRRFNKDGIRTDDFTYHYTTNKNQLHDVTGYTNAYTYNAIGQMIGEDKVEEGKDQYIEYDVTGKVTKVYSAKNVTTGAFENLKVEFLYDDRGFRLAKKVYKAGNVPDKTTWYIRDGSGNVLSIYEEDNLKNTLAQTEVPVYGAGKLGTQYPQQDDFTNYEITDHLGNVRALVREEAFDETATMETARAEHENGKFLRYENVRKIYSPLFDHTNNAPPSTPDSGGKPGSTTQGYAIRLRGGAMEKRGLAKSFAIAPGDVIHMEVYAKYLDVNRNNWRAALNTLITQIAAGTAAPGTVVDGKDYHTNGNIPLPYDGIFNLPNDLGPKAYLGWLLFDKDFVHIDGGYKRMTDFAKENGDDVDHEKLEADLHITQPGYIYIYLSNDEETPVEVYMDDFTVTHNGSYVSQATDYGVWGDVLRQQRSTLDTAYRYLYQGQFAERDKETSWNHFRSREYDPTIGRWNSVDPKRQFYSPYLGMGNNPISGFDPSGGDVILLSAPQGAGGFGHMAMLVGNDKTGWTYISKDGTNSCLGTHGSPNDMTIKNVKSEVIYCSVEEFLRSDFNRDHENPDASSEYHSGLRITTEEETDKKIIATAKKGAMSTYDVLDSNCAQNCIQPLFSNGILPYTFANYTKPNAAFEDIESYILSLNKFIFEGLDNHYPGEIFYLTSEKLPVGTITVGEGWTVPVNEPGWLGYRPDK